MAAPCRCDIDQAGHRHGARHTQSNGLGQDIDRELVRDHLTTRLVYAVADWSLERAAEEMTRGAFRHVIVMDGILSIRDIVRCWTQAGASCDVPGTAAAGA